MTAATGDPFQRNGSSERPSSPTGPPSASERSRPRPKRSGRKLFAFDRLFERRFVAGADEAGRGSPPGPPPAPAGVFWPPPPAPSARPPPPPPHPPQPRPHARGAR